MAHSTEVFVGIYVSKLRNAIAVADGERGGEVRYLGEVEASEEATIFLARFMRERAPWLWDHLLKMGQKTEAVRRAREAPVHLYTDFSYNKPNHWLVSAIAVAREKSASVAGAGQSIENQIRKPIYEVGGSLGQCKLLCQRLSPQPAVCFSATRVYAVFCGSEPVRFTQTDWNSST